MPNYLETIYFRDEYDINAYPQKLCDYIFENYYKPVIGSREGEKTLLDIGSGKGNHLVGFSRAGLKCYGLDKRPECVQILDSFDIRECNIECEPFPFEDNFFDAVFSKSVLEHVANADNFLTQTLRVLKPGGIAVLMTPDWGTQMKLFWDDYTHVKAWTRKSLQNAMIINGFSDVTSILFRQLPVLWKHPWMSVLADITCVLPDSLKWKDHEQSEFREWIRFSKEKMLLAWGIKKQ
jgi:2-polyprenyl-3-methyl-5-hydroxy-6-metoxy-1,4-benzoquinol methylase